MNWTKLGSVQIEITKEIFKQGSISLFDTYSIGSTVYIYSLAGQNRYKEMFYLLFEQETAQLKQILYMPKRTTFPTKIRIGIRLEELK